MPALNFHARFADAVENGTKCQTIRAYRKGGKDPKPGDRLVLYTGMRTKACRKLGEAVCTSARPIRMRATPWYPRVSVGGPRGGWRHLTRSETEELALLDGFPTSEEMLEWFRSTHGLPFEGLLIRWGDLA